MGKLARRTEGGTRIVTTQPATVLDLVREGEIDKDEVVYDAQTMTEAKPSDLLKPNKTYGVVPYDERG
jgi:hypothetical protein